MKKHGFLWWVLFGLLLTTSCEQKLSKQAYIKWVTSYENGFHQKKEQGGYTFDVQYKPAIYRALFETETLMDKKQLAHFLKEDSLDKMQYYDLRIGVKGGETDILKWDTPDEQVYYQKLYYFSYEFAKDIYIEHNGKKLECQLFHFERSYDLTALRTFVLGFERPLGEDKGYVLVIASEVLNIGIVKIPFELKKLPELKLQENI
jgi:hypothetical protein